MLLSSATCDANSSNKLIQTAQGCSESVGTGKMFLRCPTKGQVPQDQADRAYVATRHGVNVGAVDCVSLRPL